MKNHCSSGSLTVLGENDGDKEGVGGIGEGDEGKGVEVEPLIAKSFVCYWFGPFGRRSCDHEVMISILTRCAVV